MRSKKSIRILIRFTAVSVAAVSSVRLIIGHCAIIKRLDGSEPRIGLSVRNVALQNLSNYRIMKNFLIWLFRITLSVIAMLALLFIGSEFDLPLLSFLGIVVMIAGLYWSFNI